MSKETVGFPGHFSYSLNTEELKHFGFGSLDRDSQLGGLSRRLEAPVSELSLCTPPPFLYWRGLSTSRIEVDNIRKSPQIAWRSKPA